MESLSAIIDKRNVISLSKKSIFVLFVENPHELLAMSISFIYTDNVINTESGKKRKSITRLKFFMGGL